VDLAGKKVLVTGGAGFLGSHVVDVLRARGLPPEDVVVPRSAEYDLRDAYEAELLFGSDRFDLAIHCAARIGGIGASRAAPGEFFYENLMIGANVVEQARRHEVEKLVLIGTVCSYPKHAIVPFCEDDLWLGYPEETNAPYGLAKKMLLVQAQAYRQQYAINAVALLLTNLYGPRDNFDPETSHVIPALIKKIHEALRDGKEVVELWGDGAPTRDFLYVEDAAEAVVRAAERYDGADPVNVGSGADISMRDLAELVGGMMGYDGEFEWDESRPNGQPRRRLDVARAKERLGFEAGVPIVDGVQRTIDWWKNEMLC
jgi:GDP-L-fucose synthase